MHQRAGHTSIAEAPHIERSQYHRAECDAWCVGCLSALGAIRAPIHAPAVLALHIFVIFGMGVVLRLLLPILVAAHSLVILFYEQNAQAAHSVCCRFCLLQYAEYGFFHLSYLPLFGSLQLIILPKRGMPIPTSGSSSHPPMAVHWGCRCSRCACRR